MSVVNECALAMDNAHNAAEKERAADLAKSEQLRPVCYMTMSMRRKDIEI